MLQERFQKLLLIGGGGLLLSPLVAVLSWSVLGAIWGNIAILFLTAGWYWTLRYFVSRDRPFPIALTAEEDARRRDQRARSAEPKQIAHRA